MHSEHHRRKTHAQARSPRAAESSFSARIAAEAVRSAAARCFTDDGTLAEASREMKDAAAGSGGLHEAYLLSISLSCLTLSLLSC